MGKQWQADVIITLIERQAFEFVPADKTPQMGSTFYQHRFTVLTEEGQEESLVEQALEEALAQAMGKRLGD